MLVVSIITAAVYMPKFPPTLTKDVFYDEGFKGNPDETISRNFSAFITTKKFRAKKKQREVNWLVSYNLIQLIPLIKDFSTRHL